LSLSRVLKHLSVFVVVFLMTVAYVGNPTIVNAYKSGFAATSSSSAGSSTSSSQQFSTVPTSVPGILSKAKLLGPVSPDEQVSLEFMLPLRNPAGLQSFLSEVYNPDSSLYRHFLTSSQFYAFYGPDPNEVAALITYMQSKGVQIHISATNPSVAEVKGTVSQIEEALKTQLDSFSWDGQVFYSATSQAQLPSQFSNIQMIYGLEDFDSQLGGTGAVPLYRTLGTVAPGQTSSSFPLYYSPSEISQMYNATWLHNAGYNGTGVQIAIVDAYGDPYIQQELQNFSAEFGLPFYSGTLNIIPVGPYNPENGIYTGWNVEVALDVEWAHAMAPNATINLYVAADSGNYLLDAVLNATLGSNGRAYHVYHNSIISMSWAEPENDWASSTPVDPVYGLNYPWLDQVFQMDAALGITAFGSSGDWGAYDQTYGQTSPYGGAAYPSTDPYVTGVGGTSLYMNTTSGYYQWPYANATGTYGNETAWSWNNYYEWGTGGGWSTLFGQPSWQDGPGVLDNGQRGNPDVAWDADPQTGVLVSIFTGFSYEYYIIGGTSVGSPCWAGSMALIDQRAGSPLGFINPAIYSILNNPTEYSKAFHDITVGNNNPDSATAGWDPLTGVGSPNLGELANYLAPTGQLPVVVTNDFSHVSDFNRTYSYGQVVNLTAVVANNRSISGPVTASFTSSTGRTIASNIVMTYNHSTGKWLGSYQIKATDPSGEWSVTVTAVNASSTGEGYTSFAVGDGVTITSPVGQFYQVGDIIYVYSYVINPNVPALNSTMLNSTLVGPNFITEGNYTAVFYLAQNQINGNGLGKVEGKVPLQFSSVDNYWEGNFTVPKSADQGAWIIVVNGTDKKYGNKGSAYTWINVGLYVSPFTDSPTYVLGDRISIFAYPSYEDGLEAETGTFTALIYDGSVFVANVPLTFTHKTGLGVSYDELGLWKGTFTPSVGSPTGLYTITVNGTDGKGNYGSFATVVRVAQYLLSVNASVSNRVLPVQNGNESWVLAKITYPDDDSMTVGSVTGELSLNLGGGIMSEVGWFTMTHNTTAGGFVAVNLFHAVNATVTPIGNYTLNIEAYDASGNYGNATTSFFVTGKNRASIDITEDKEFNATNGVIEGNGTSVNPYLIAGWNVSSISIANVTSRYVLLNNYVSGSVGNGITIDTPDSAPLVDYVYVVRNGGYGLYANGSAAGSYAEVIAGDNAKDGMLIANDTHAVNGTVALCVAYNNKLNGIVYDTSSQPSFFLDVAVDNTQVGLLSQDSNGTSFVLNEVNGSAAGIKVTAKPNSWYGGTYAELNIVQNNSVGIYVDGLGQNLTTKKVFGSLSNATLLGNIALHNDVGIYATDQAVILAEANIVAESQSNGISTLDSLTLLAENIVLLSSGNGIQVVGQSTFEMQVFQAGEIYPYSNGNFTSVLEDNELILNGNATMFSGSGISLADANSSAILSNYCMLSGDDGIELNNVTGGSLISPTTFVAANYVENNTMNGIEADNVSHVIFFAEIEFFFVSGNYGEGNTQNGIEVKGGSSNLFAYDEWEYNAQDGMLFASGSSQNLVEVDYAAFNHHGFEITQAGWNTLDYVYAENNTGTTNSPGVGVVFGPGATDNYMFDYSMSTFNDVGVEFNGSQSNVVQSCGIWYNNMYGFYFVNGAQNDYAGNSLLGNGAPEFPTPPSLVITSPVEGSTVNGTVTLSWNESGQSLSYTTVTIDGVPNTATRNSFLWNTTSLPDGVHTIVVSVTDTGGFSASQTVYLVTDNQLLATEATISGLNETLTSSMAAEASLNSTVQNLQSTLSSLNKTLASSIASQASLNNTLQNLRSQVSSLESQLGSLNTTLQNTKADVNGLKNDGYIAIAVIIIIIALIAAAVAIMMRRRRGAVSSSQPAPVTQSP
jgi:subtilase family serine protease